MPNWVYNGISVTGNKDDLDKFVEQVGRTYTRQYTRMEKSGDGFVTITEDAEWKGDFCFWNIHAPDESILAEYYGEASFGEGMSENNWYAWNNNNWGTKWDVDGQVERLADDHLLVRCETAWSPPYPVLETAAKQHPNLTFTLEWEEEQGFGAEAVFAYGESREVRSWDIPSSHKDYIERDLECYCVIGEPEEYWFDDCPRPIAEDTKRFEEVSATL